MAKGAMQQNSVLAVTLVHQATGDFENVVEEVASAANEARHLRQYKHLS